MESREEQFAIEELAVGIVRNGKIGRVGEKVKTIPVVTGKINHLLKENH